MSPVRPNVVLVDYSVASIMMPTTLAGSQIGTQLILNTFPAIIVQTLLTVLLAFLTWNSYTKAIELHRKETAVLRQN